jgi:hypothetical protein
MWVVARLAPQRYGDRVTTELTGADGRDLIPASRATPDRVAAVFLALTEKLPRVGARKADNEGGEGTDESREP